MADSSLEPAYSQCAALVGAAVFKYGYLCSLGLVSAHLALDASCQSSLVAQLPAPTRRHGSALTIDCACLDCAARRYRRYTSPVVRFGIGGSQRSTLRGTARRPIAPLSVCVGPLSLPLSLSLSLFLFPSPAAVVAFVAWVGGYRAKQVCLRRIAEQEAAELSNRKELHCPKGITHLYLAHNPPYVAASPRPMPQ